MHYKFLISYCKNIYLIPLIILFICSIYSTLAHYNGYKVYEIIPSNEKQANILEKMYKSNRFDFWTNSRLPHRPSVIMVAPQLIQNFLHIIKTNSLQYKEMIDDVAKFHTCGTKSRVCKHISRVFSIEKYNTYKGIKNYLNELENRYSRNVKKFVIAKTAEGRDVMGIKISADSSNESKPAILIDAGIHAREWISTATALYFIYQLTENKSNQEMLSDVDWYIIPLLNPDGYVYSQKADRLWRKNRSKGNTCTGVDNNRNFGYHWKEAGASSNECSEIYAGPAPFSEPETNGFRNFVMKHKQNIKVYLTLHSYGCYILYPWSFRAPQCSNTPELQKIGEIIAGTIEKRNGRKYIVGPSRRILYEASGNSEDWVKGVAGVDLCFAMELPGGGNEGFGLPANRITEVGSETFDGIKQLWLYIIAKNS